MPRRIPAVVVFCAVPLAAALLLFSCGSETGDGASATKQAATTQVVTTAISRESSTTTITTTTTNMWSYSMTTSAAFAANSQQAMDAALKLGGAVVSYLNQKEDLAAVQALVASSAQDGLTQMLSLLARPTGCKVWSTGGSSPFSEIEVQLVFADGRSQQPDFTLTVAFDSDNATIAGIAPTSPPSLPPPVHHTVPTTEAGRTTGSLVPVIQVQDEPNLEYMTTHYSYYTAEVVALAKVVEALPPRRNPLAGTGALDGPNEHQPVVYKGYVLQVEKAYGPDSIPERITVYALGNGTIVLDGVTYEVREEFPLDAKPGDKLFVPLVKVAYFGTPELKQDEYWVQANWAVFAADDSGNCTRVTGADVDPENRSEFPLSDLENAAVEQGKKPSLID